MAQMGKCCWAQKVISMFDNAGFSDSFSTVNGCNQTLRNAIMCTYRDQFIQKWHSDLMREHSLDGNGGNRLRTYREFKTIFQLEQYIINVTNTSLRSALTQLRVGCHGLEIERGRYHKPKIPVSERLCNTCDTIED